MRYTVTCQTASGVSQDTDVDARTQSGAEGRAVRKLAAADRASGIAPRGWRPLTSLPKGGHR